MAEEKQVVDRIILLEKREQITLDEIQYTEHLMFEQLAFGDLSSYLNDRWDKLQEDLETVQGELAAL